MFVFRISRAPPPATYKLFLYHTTSNISKALGSCVFLRDLSRTEVVLKKTICLGEGEYRSLTYPTLGSSEKSSTQKWLGRGYVIVSRRVGLKRPSTSPIYCSICHIYTALFITLVIGYALQIHVLVDAANISWKWNVAKTPIHHLHITEKFTSSSASKWHQTSHSEHRIFIFD